MAAQQQQQRPPQQQQQQQNDKFVFPKNMDLLSKYPMNNEDICLEAGYYLHKKPLGEGGFGKVRLATHLRTNQKVAIKMMNKEKLGQDLQRVRIEVEALKILQHENIAKLLQVFETDTDIYLVLEYCNGGELFDYLIAKRRLTETEVRIIMKDLFKVLLYIHNRGFAHRDLKPENILFDNNHRIKLIDFGLAANSSKNKAALSFLQTCCGSPAYAAPELLRGLTYSGPAVDVWSAGILLYSLLVGQLPFDDENMNNLYKKIQLGRFTMPQWLSSDVRDLISLMLRTNPCDRITVAKALDHRWIRKGFTSVSPTMPPQLFSSQSNPLSPNGIDARIFSILQQLFPQMSDIELRGRLKLFGYVTATYLILKNDPQAVKAVQEQLQLKMKPLVQQQKELSLMTCMNIHQNSSSPVQPRIAAIKRKLQLDCETPATSSPASAPTNQSDQKIEPVAKKIKETPKKPILTGINSSPAKLPPLLVERKQMLMNNVQNGSNSPNNRTNDVKNRITPIKARKIKSPKLKMATNENSIVKSPIANNNSNPLTIKSPLRDMRNQILSPNKPQTPIKETAKPTTPVKSAKTSAAETPSKSSKKSLLRRLMESATPNGKSSLNNSNINNNNSPRKLDQSMQANNITMTIYTEPQECIDHLKRTLCSKGVECKQKKYVNIANNSNDNRLSSKLISSFTLSLMRKKNQTFLRKCCQKPQQQKQRTFVLKHKLKQSLRPNMKITSHLDNKWKRLTFLIKNHR